MLIGPREAREQVAEQSGPALANATGTSDAIPHWTVVTVPAPEFTMYQLPVDGR